MPRVRPGREPVADAVHRFDVARSAGIALDLLAQVLDRGVDRALVAGEVVSLRAIDQLNARVHAAGAGRQRERQLVLARRQRRPNRRRRTPRGAPGRSASAQHRSSAAPPAACPPTLSGGAPPGRAPPARGGLAWSGSRRPQVEPCTRCSSLAFAVSIRTATSERLRAAAQLSSPDMSGSTRSKTSSAGRLAAASARPSRPAVAEWTIQPLALEVAACDVHPGLVVDGEDSLVHVRVARRKPQRTDGAARMLAIAAFPTVCRTT